MFCYGLYDTLAVAQGVRETTTILGYQGDSRMRYDDNVLQAMSSVNVVIATRRHNLWPDEIESLEKALAILDKLRVEPNES